VTTWENASLIRMLWQKSKLLKRLSQLNDAKAGPLGASTAEQG